MQRLFTSFPDRWPGVGLLLLRCSLATELLKQSLQNLLSAGHDPIVLPVADGLALLLAVALLLGIVTPLAAIAGGASLIALAAPGAPSYFLRSCELIRLVSFASSIALVGPGAFSIDGLLFGRKEIIVPRLPPSYGG